MKTCFLFLSPVIAILLIPSIATAQPDPPGRVARINYASGAVSMLTQASGADWMPAQINFPLTTGDQIWTDAGARAELQIGNASIRLRDQTSAGFTVLDDQIVQTQLIAGGLNVKVRRLYDQEVVEIDTPNVAVTIRQPGDYRVEVVGEQTRVIVWSGAAELSGDNRTLPLRARDYAVVSGFGQLSYNLMNAPGTDDFDRWAQDRDRRVQQSQSVRYVSPSMIGYEDLDDHGAWRESQGLGMVWVPQVEAGWAPYKFGHWAWVEPWGWTWIDDAPWGFAPFHYGRWAYVTGSWAWIPGPPAQRAVYSPALVAWAGGGGGLRVSASIGTGMAWFALGPGEVYVPAHRCSERYVQNVNVTNTVVNRTVITNVYNTTIVNKTVVNNVTYVNQNAPGAVVGMSHADMAAGRRGAATVAPAQFQAAQVSAVAPVPATRPVIQPLTRGGPVAVVRPPAAVAAPSRPMVVRNQAPAAAQRPVFTSATGVAGPAPVQRPSQVSPQQPFRGPVIRESTETVRPAPPAAREGAQPQRQPQPAQPVPPQPQAERPQTQVGRPQPQVVRPPNDSRLPAPATEGVPVRRAPQAETPPAAPTPQQQARPERPAPRVDRPSETPVIKIERPAQRAPQTETPSPQVRPDRPPQSAPERRVEPRQDRPAPAAEAPKPQRPEVRPEPRPAEVRPPAEQQHRPEPRPQEKKPEDKKDEKKTDKKDK